LIGEKGDTSSKSIPNPEDPKNPIFSCRFGTEDPVGA